MRCILDIDDRGEAIDAIYQDVTTAACQIDNSALELFCSLQRREVQEIRATRRSFDAVLRRITRDSCVYPAQVVLEHRRLDACGVSSGRLWCRRCLAVICGSKSFAKFFVNGNLTLACLTERSLGSLPVQQLPVCRGTRSRCLS